MAPPPRNPPGPVMDTVDHSECKARTAGEEALRRSYWQLLLAQLHQDPTSRIAVLPFDVVKVIAGMVAMPRDARGWIIPHTITPARRRFPFEHTLWSGTCECQGGSKASMYVVTHVSNSASTSFSEVDFYFACPGTLPLQGTIVQGQTYCFVFEDEVERYETVWERFLRLGSDVNEACVLQIIRAIVKHIEAIEAAKDEMHKKFRFTQLTMDDVLVEGDRVVFVNPWPRIVDELRVRMSASVGSPQWVAPEVLCAEYSSCDKILLWSAGCIMYTLLCGFPPFYGDSVPELFSRIMGNDYEFPPEYAEHISQAAKDVVAAILVPHTDRPSAKDILQMAWFQNASEVSLVSFGSNWQNMFARFCNNGRYSSVDRDRFVDNDQGEMRLIVQEMCTQ